jgi:hypothetical protein
MGQLVRLKDFPTVVGKKKREGLTSWSNSLFPAISTWWEVMAKQVKKDHRHKINK